METHMRRTILAFAVLMTGSAAAADANQQFYIMGDPGVMTCATLSTKLNDEQAGVMLGTWIGGYVTALNRNLPETYNVLGGVQLGDFFNDVIAACAASPESRVESAVFVAIDKAMATKQTKAP